MGVALVTPSQQGDVSRMAARLQIGAELEAEGMVVAPPRLVFTSRGRRAGMQRHRPRRPF